MTRRCDERRRFIPEVGQPMEHRVLPSSIGLSRPAPPLAEVANLPTTGREAVQTARGRDESTAIGAVDPLCDTTPRAPVAPTVRRWAWLADTDWYVPTHNLPATVFDSSSNTLIPVSDQTVFQITGYREGYFWGKSVTQLGSSSPSGMSMVGSVTPEGRVVLTFTTTESGSSPTVTEGFGQMRRKLGQWTMENQMFTSPGSTVQVGHWAYMMQTHPGLASWNSLPGVGVSVPTFLGEAGGSAPEPVSP